MLDGWRWTWATGAFVLFATFLASAINRNDATTGGTLALDYVLAFVGLAVFVIAMVRPKWLPGRTAVEREEVERERERHESEVALEARKENVRRNPMGRFAPSHGDSDRRRLTDSNNFLATEMRLQREARERQPDSPDESSSSQGST